jgi:hypothetical protein
MHFFLGGGGGFFILGTDPFLFLGGSGRLQYIDLPVLLSLDFNIVETHPRIINNIISSVIFA